MATARRTLTRTEESMEFYKTQPVSYRRLWWEWASREPNFREMVRWARAHEKDADVLRIMEGWADSSTVIMEGRAKDAGS